MSNMSVPLYGRSVTAISLQLDRAFEVATETVPSGWTVNKVSSTYAQLERSNATSLLGLDAVAVSITDTTYKGPVACTVTYETNGTAEVECKGLTTGGSHRISSMGRRYVCSSRRYRSLLRRAR